MYSIFKYGSQMLLNISDLEQAKKEAIQFVISRGSDHIEIQDQDGETVTIGYFDGRRFHWTKDKEQTGAWKTLSFVTKPPLWKGERSKEGRV